VRGFGVSLSVVNPPERTDGTQARGCCGRWLSRSPRSCDRSSNIQTILKVPLNRTEVDE
jgi:hypothetical protein